MTAHIGTVARKDFSDAGRSKLLWVLVGLLVVIVAVGYVAIWSTIDDVSGAEVLGFLGFPLQVVLPVAALIVGYMAVVGERRSGSIKLLLGLPPNRTDVVFGKLLGRTAVVVVAVALAFVLSLVLFGSVPFVDWLAFGALTILFGVTFVGIAVGVSASVSSRGRSMALVVGVYMVLVALWELLTAGSYYLLYDEGPPLEPETWYLLLDQFNPIFAYTNLASSVVEGDIFPFQFQYGLESIEAYQLTPAERYAGSGDAPFFLQEWFGLVVLVVWLVVPVAIGYYRFQRAEL
ncbi:ABC transporter [Halostagnicola sp. A56]|uniref:ABC transporter permease n=1 Tax=Halostagnicola sp. A56 TaxID=1495067 RepID=UPI0004A19894|nr:ABC transporter permease subunit [Halostagnicola sp. A56]KDE59424.1 ABC transporter [Halostagnicola sp. A56]